MRSPRTPFRAAADGLALGLGFAALECLTEPVDSGRAPSGHGLDRRIMTQALERTSRQHPGLASDGMFGLLNRSLSGSGNRVTDP